MHVILPRCSLMTYDNKPTNHRVALKCKIMIQFKIRRHRKEKHELVCHSLHPMCARRVTSYTVNNSTATYRVEYFCVCKELPLSIDDHGSAP